MKKILILLIAIALSGCDSEGERMLCVNIDTSIKFSILNDKSEDLLDPDNPNSFDVSEIKLFYEIDGKIYDSTPERFFIDKDLTTNKYQISISLNSYDLRKKTITYIQWNEKYKDNVQATFASDYCLTRVDKVWLNDVLIVKGFHSSNFYTIIK